MSSFHFTSSPPSAQLVRDVQSLSSWPLEALQPFSGVLLAFLSQNPAQESVLKQFVESHPQLAEQARPCLTSLLTFFSASIKRGGSNTSAHVRADLAALGLDAERAELLSSQCLSSLSEAVEVALSKTLQAAQLEDIAWKFGVSAGGSEVDKMGSCFLQLQMNIDPGNEIEV